MNKLMVITGCLFVVLLVVACASAEADTAQLQGDTYWYNIESPAGRCYDYVLVWKFHSWTAGMSEVECDA